MRYCYLVFILFYCSSAFAQRFQLDGLVNIAGTRSKYSLSLNRIGQKIEGFSYANIGTEDETKCSIIGSIDTIKELLNLKIKRRESFRPFAPSILKEQVKDWFELDEPVPFMEKVFPIKKCKNLPQKKSLCYSENFMIIQLLIGYNMN